MKSTVVLAGTIALVVAAPVRANARPHIDAAGNLIRDAQSCGTTRIAGPVVATPFAAPTTPRTIYLNKNGGTYTIGGATNASTNTASTIAAGDNRPHAGAVIPPIETSFNWPYIVDCVKKQYKPYNVIITETEPTSGNYVEAVVGGNGASTGWSASSGILGVAAADNFCQVTEKGIAFSFSTNHRGINKPNDELCATVAHEIGHLLALEHEIAGPDTMSYVPFATAGQKSFTSPTSQCGTDAQNTVNCSCPTSGAGQVTSSAMRLTQYLGLRPIETKPPTLEVTAPGNAKTVRPSFAVTANATDETAMDQVAVLLDGVMTASSSTPQGSTYTIELADVPEGMYTLQVQAIDLAGNITKQDLTITVARAATGEACTENADCHGGICATESSGSSFCTQTCGDGNSCPGDFDCATVDTQDICIPTSGGCAAGGGSPIGLLVVLGALLAMRRRSAAT